MPLDIVLFREAQGGNPEMVRESQRRRFKPVEEVHKVIALDSLMRNFKHRMELTKGDINKLKEEITKKNKGR